MYENARPYAVYCEEHGLQFITQEQFDQNDQTCPRQFCMLKGDFEHTLFKAAMVDGCAYCHKAPVVPSDSNKSFWYDEKTGKVYCHQACFKCSQRKCTAKGCAAKAKKAVYIVFGDTDVEYLVPACFCYLHCDKMPAVPNDALWSFVCANHKQIPDRSKCRIELRDLP